MRVRARAQSPTCDRSKDGDAASCSHERSAEVRRSQSHELAIRGDGVAVLASVFAGCDDGIDNTYDGRDERGGELSPCQDWCRRRR
jgi:hypothetical protein